MVFQEESFATRWWPFASRSPMSADQGKCKGFWSTSRVQAKESNKEGLDALDFADSMEKGMVHEFTNDFVKPQPQSGKLNKFYVKRSENRLYYRLFRDNGPKPGEGGDFLMYSEMRLDQKEAHFFLYDPEDKDSLYDGQKPAFVMDHNQSKTEWLLTQTPERDWYSPRHQNSKRREKEEVVCIRHSRCKVGEGVNHCLDADIAIGPDSKDPPGSPKLPRRQEDLEIDHLITRQAVWNEELQTLVLDFKGREVIPSAKNFQLVREDRVNRILCQHGKIGKNTFGLDFRFPLSISQAFAMAVSTLFWE